MHSLFRFAGGSVSGRSHRIAAKNNQDAYCLMCEGQWAVAVVCDGCGSGEHSEVGAQIGARLIAQSLFDVMRREPPQSDTEETSPVDVEVWLEQARQSALANLLSLSTGMGDMLWTVSHYFLFTIVGALLTPTRAVFFSLGDGVLAVNDQVTVLGPFPGNAPPYLAYALLDEGVFRGNSTIHPDSLRFQVHQVMPMRELHSFLLGTDGVQDLMQAAERFIPGKAEAKTELVGPLSQFWQEERFFCNPDMLRRRLAGIARDVVTRSDGGMRKEAGLLSDDTTLIVGRRSMMTKTGTNKCVGGAK
jgi:hypothetical protein